MPDTIGGVTVPEVFATSGVFPLVTDYPHGGRIEPAVAVHPFRSAGTKIEQRYLLGNGARRWRAKWSDLSRADVDTLRIFWDARKGAYQPFTYNLPSDDGLTTTPTIVRFEDEPLSFSYLLDAVAETGVGFVEVPQTSPTYTVAQTLTRFPDTSLEAALTGQAQQLIPLVTIRPRAAGYPAIYLSDRRVTVGGQLYQARLLGWDGISQRLNAEADSAQFIFGNADRVMRDLAADTDLFRASIEFALFHVATLVRVDLWKGEVLDFESTGESEFTIAAGDGLYELTLQYPPDKISPSCWKKFNDGLGCPYAAEGSLDLVNFPSAQAGNCDHGYSTPNGCQAHNMDRRFGGVIAEPQSVRVRDNTSGFFGLGRQSLTATSLVADSVMGQPLIEIYTDTPIPVKTLIVSGRDESEFYIALGIVGAGPLGAYARGTIDQNGNRRMHKLDGQPNHGDPGTGGLREILGTDPAGATDFLSLDQAGNQVNGDPGKVYVGNSTYLNNLSAGVAFIVLRRSDEKGVQLTTLDEHTLEAVVAQGLTGWVWTAPGARSQALLTNPVWIAVNVYLKGIGQRFASAAVAETFFDVQSAIAAASIANEVTPKIIGPGNETQFVFQGVLRDVKVLKDWIQEILNSCLGFTVFSFGRLKFGIRSDAAAEHSFSDGNILAGTLSLAPVRPAFNRITMAFANRDYEFVADSIPVQDLDHIDLIGKPLDASMNLVGAAGKSMAGRIGAVRLKEELGGVGAVEWKKARRASWRTTVLALGVEAGQGVSIDHEDVPGSTGLFRVTGWKLNPDYSIDLEGRTITDSMYDQVAGPKAVDVPANGVPSEFFPQPLRAVWHPHEVSPDIDDPIAEGETFALSQSYNSLEDGTKQVILTVRGKQAINDFIPDTIAPLIGGQSQATSGGTLPGSRNYWVTIAAVDALSRSTPPSNVRRFTFESAPGNTNQITLSALTWPAGSFAGYVLYAGDDERTMCAQVEVTGALPAAIVFSGPFKRSTFNAPSPTHRTVKAKVKDILHGGVIGEQLSVVGTGGSYVTLLSLAGGSTDFTGRILTVYAKADLTAPLLNYLITGHNLATGDLNLTPDPAALDIGDVVVIRCQATTATATTIGDALFQNSIYPLGLTVDAEAGALIRMLTGAARGQIRRVVSNTATVYTVDRAFEPAPAIGDRFLVEAADYQYEAESAPVLTSRRDVPLEIRPEVANLAARSVLVAAIAVDVRGGEAPEELSPFRETFLFGDGSGSIVAPAGDAPQILNASAGVRYTQLDTDTGKALFWRIEATWELPVLDPDLPALHDILVTLYPVVAGVEGDPIGIGTVEGTATEFFSDWWQFGSDADYRLKFTSRNYQGVAAYDPVSYPEPPAVLEVRADGAAPNVLLFRAGSLQADGSFLAVTRTDTLREKVLVDYSCVRPFNLLNWDNFRVFIKTPAIIADATGPIKAADFNEVGGQWEFFGTISIEGNDVPAVAENWDFIACSADAAGNLNLSAGDPTGPTVTLSISRPADNILEQPPILAPAAWSLNSLIYSANAAGTQQVFIAATIITPSPGADYYSLFWQQTATPVDGQWIEIAADAKAGTWRDRPELGASWVVAIVANKSTFKVQQPPNGTTYKVLNIAAWGNSPQGSALSVAVETEARGGVPNGRFVITFSPPNSVEYWFSRVERIATDASFTPLGGAVWTEIGDFNGKPDGAAQVFEMGWWPMPTNIEYWKFRVASINFAGIKNTVGIPEANVTVGASTKLQLNQYDPATIAAHLGATGGVLGVLPNAITEALIQDFVITQLSLADSAAITRVLAPSAVDSSKLAALAVIAGKIGPLAVDSAQLADAAVITAKLGALAVDNSKLAALAVDAAKLATGAVTSTKIGALAVGTAAIQAAAIGTAQIANAAITTALIGDAQIVQAKIGNAAVGSAQIGSAAIGSAAIQTLAVGFAAIQDAAIQNAKLDRASANKIAIVDADVVTLAANKILAGTLVAGVIYGGTINATQINAGLMTAVTISLTLNGITTTITNAYDGPSASYVGFKTVRTSDSRYAQLSYVGLYMGGGGLASTYCDFTGLYLGFDSLNFAEYSRSKVSMKNTSGVEKILLDVATARITGDEVRIKTKLLVDNYATSGSPASAATHKVPVYDAAGNLLNYMFLYP